MQPHFIGLDFDGVVVDGSNQGYFDAYHVALEHVGVTLPPEIERARIVERWGQSHIDELRLLLQEHPEHVETAGRVWLDYVHSDRFWNHVHVIDGAGEAIRLMSQHATVVIVSGTERAFIEKILEREHIEDVSEIYSSYDVASELRKPHPHTLLRALEDAGCSPEGALYVGDMKNDIVMARAAGVTPAVVLTGELTREVAEAEGVEIIEPDLLALARRVFRS